METENTKSSHVVILVILIIVAAVMLYYSLQNSGGESAVVETPAPVASAPAEEPPKVQRVVSASDLTLKADILKKISTEGVLSAKDKAEIYAAISGDNINKYNFTGAEMKKIIEVLNRK